MKKDFINWVINEVNARGWNNSELARQANLGPSTISMVLSGQSKPGLEFCVGIAQAFGEPPERVLRRAGLLPPLPALEGEGVNYAELWEIIRNMSVEERLNVFEYARWRLSEEKRKREERNRPAPPSGGGGDMDFAEG